MRPGQVMQRVVELAKTHGKFVHEFAGMIRAALRQADAGVAHPKVRTKDTILMNIKAPDMLRTPAATLGRQLLGRQLGRIGKHSRVQWKDFRLPSIGARAQQRAIDYACGLGR